MSNEEIGRIGVACVVAAIGAMAQLNSEFCVRFSLEPFYWWLLMIVGCGVTLDSENGSSRVVLLGGSLACSFAFIGACLFFAFLVTEQSPTEQSPAQQYCFSVISKDSPAFLGVVLMLFAITSVSIFLQSFARPIWSGIAKWFTDPGTEADLNRAEKSVRAIVTLIAALTLLLGVAL